VLSLQDASLPWNADLTASAIGDIALVSGTAWSQQRVLRRLLTNPGDYIWQPNYGAGLGALVGQTIDILAIQALIRSQIFQEASVANVPEPSVTVSSSDGNTIWVDIRYVDATTGETQVLTFSIGS
jgi:phage baseplate assembly protein W